MDFLFALGGGQSVSLMPEWIFEHFSPFFVVVVFVSQKAWKSGQYESNIYRHIEQWFNENENVDLAVQEWLRKV